MKFCYVILFVILTTAMAAEIDDRIPNVEEITTGVEPFVKKNPIVLLTTYAPWCEYSKRMVGILKTIAEVVSSDPLAKTKVKIAKLNGNFYGEEAAAMGVTNYPQIVLFVNGVPKGYNGIPNVDQLLSFINGEVGLNLRHQKSKKSKEMIILTDNTIDSYLKNSNDFIVLQILSRSSKSAQEVAGWYQTFLDAFKNEPQILIAAMDAEKNPKTSLKMKVDPATPKIVVLTKGKQYPFNEPELTPGAVLYFINKVVGTNRNLDGSLNNKAGRVADLHKEVKGIAFKMELINKAITKTDEMIKAEPKNTDIALYQRILKKISEKGPQWVTSEITRLGGLLHKGSVCRYNLFFTVLVNCNYHLHLNN